MKLKGIKYNKKEGPETITVTMTLDEAAFITKATGKLNYDAANAILPGSGPVVSEIWNCLVSVFNRHWDDGVDGYLSGATE
jgi:hypothetical protein